MTDVKPTLKRSRENGNINQAAEEPGKEEDVKPTVKRSRENGKELGKEEGLRELVKKRRRDVGELENRIASLEHELRVARKKLAAAETFLQTLEGPDKNVETKNGDSIQSAAAKHRNGISETKPAVGSSKTSSSKVVTTSGIRLESTPGKTSGNHGSARIQLTTAAGLRASGNKSDRKGLDHTVGEEKLGKAGRSSNAPVEQQHVDLITKIKSTYKAQPVAFYNPVFSSSRHRRKMRTLALNPSSDNQCATSALDGVINFWQVDVKGMDIIFRYTVDCLSPQQRHWPEDIAWHPDGHSLFAIYTADKKDAQVAIIKNDIKQKSAIFLDDKPHIKGILNGIAFMPWSSSLFVTGGSDHMVQMWHNKEDDVWRAKLLHGDLHTSSVCGVAGTRHRQLVLSAGADKRVIGFDPAASRMLFKHDLDSKGMTVSPNTADFNLFMVQTGQPNKQLHLFDIRTKSELHTFGWHQESSDTQSTLISQSWSPDGFYIASGTADPKIVLFDIRFNGREPAQTIYAHSKRVFMAVWHQTLPLLLSISSDLNIGVHRMTGK